MTSDAARPDLELLLAEAGWVRKLAHSLVSDPSAAEDVVQETWLAVLKRPPRTDLPLRPWLSRVVANFARMRKRGDASRVAREERVARSESVGASDELVARIETQRALARDVLALSEPFRSTIVLRYYEGLSAAEIARRVGSPAATVRWRLMRGLELLREELDRRHRGERSAWMELLAPLSSTFDGPGVSTATLARSAASGGAFALARWLVLALLLLIGGLGWLGLRGGEAARDAARPTESAPGVASSTGATAASVGSEERVAVGASSEAAVESKLARSRVSARIVDVARRAIAGAQLVERAGGAASDLAASNGAVALETRSSGELRAFEARARGFVSELVEARTAEGATHLGVIVLARACSIEGVVEDSDGHALAGARVRAEIIGSRWAGVRELPLEEARHIEALLGDAPLASADAVGSFRFDGLRQGWVRLWASADGFTTSWSDDLALEAGVTKIAPRLRLSRTPESARIAGVVLDASGAPVPSAEIECARPSLGAAFFRGERYVISARADALGRFEFGVDPASRYVVAARGAGQIGAVAPVVPGTRELVVRIGPRRRLELAAFDEGGRLLADCAVRFEQLPHGRELALETNSFALGLADAPLVPFRVHFDAPGFARRTLGPFEPASTPPRIECTLTSSAALTVFVVANGAAVAGAALELLPAPPPPRARVLDGVASHGGPFAVRLAREASVITLRANADGRAVCDVPSAGDYLVRVWAPGFAPTLLGPIELSPSARSTHEVVLSNGGSLAGRVLHSDGLEVAGTLVGISCGDGWLATARVGEDGAYRFDGLAAGRWQVRKLEREARSTPWSRLDLTGLSRMLFDAAWDVEVHEGAVASFDLVVGESKMPLLQGRLTFDRVAPGAWQVQVRGGPDTRIARATLDPDGEFELRLPRAGSYELELFRAARGGAAITLTDTLEVGAEGASWTLDLDCTHLVVGVEGDEPPGSWARIAWRGSGVLALHASCELTDAARADFGLVPAGSYTVEHARGDSSASVTLDVKAGAQFEFLFPSAR